MKKFLVMSLVSVVSVVGFARVVAQNETGIFQERALAVLTQEANHLAMYGDVGATENLADILKTISRAQHTSNSCIITSVISAQCTLFIRHGNIGETAVIYKLSLDRTKMPEKITEAVEISRGD